MRLFLILLAIFSGELLATEAIQKRYPFEFGSIDSKRNGCCTFSGSFTELDDRDTMQLDSVVLDINRKREFLATADIKAGHYEMVLDTMVDSDIVGSVNMVYTFICRPNDMECNEGTRVSIPVSFDVKCGKTGRAKITMDHDSIDEGHAVNNMVQTNKSRKKVRGFVEVSVSKTGNCN